MEAGNAPHLRNFLMATFVFCLGAGPAAGADGVRVRDIRQVSIVKDLYPFFSPDGKRIVFHSNRSGGEYQILTMNLDGSDVVALTKTGASNQTGVYSPDGEKIAFQSERDGNREIYVMDADGGNPVNITGNPYEDSHPKWSSDGRWILFDSVRANPESGHENLYLMRPDGSEVRRLTEYDEVDSYGSLSPDGRKIVWRRILPTGGDTESGRNSEVFIMNRDGTGIRNLTNHSSFDGYPSASPDGRWIAFASNRDGKSFDDFNIFLMDTEGRNLTRLTETIPNVEQVRPMFSPDGRKIVFNRDWPDGRVEIHMIELDLTGKPGRLLDPSTCTGSFISRGTEFGRSSGSGG